MVSKSQAKRVKERKRNQERRNVVNGDEQIINSSESVHVVDRNGRVMGYSETSSAISDFSKSLPRNYLY